MNAGPGVPPRPLLVLCALVFVAHGLALQGAAATVAWQQRRERAPSPAAPDTATRMLLVGAGATAHHSPDQASDAASPERAKPRPASPPRAPETPSRLPSDLNSPGEPALPSPRVQIPGSARWHYTATALHRGTIVAGRAELAWWHDGRRYEASLRWDVPPIAPRVQASAGTLQPHGLAPLRFSERHRTEEAVHFDRDAGRIVFSARPGAVPLLAGTQDRLSVLLQLSALVSARPQGWAAGDRVTVQTATTREAREWLFIVDGTETLALPAGPTDALKLTRAPQGEWSPRLELWFVPGTDYGPVRLRLTPPNGEWLDIQWSGTDKG